MDFFRHLHIIKIKVTAYFRFIGYILLIPFFFINIYALNTYESEYKSYPPLDNLHIEKEMLIGVSWNIAFAYIPEFRAFDICKNIPGYLQYNPIIFDFSEFIKSNNYDSIFNYWCFLNCDSYGQSEFYKTIFEGASNYKREYDDCYKYYNTCIAPNYYESPVSKTVKKFNSRILKNYLYLFTCKMTYLSYPEKKEHWYMPDFDYDTTISFDLDKYECYELLKNVFNDFYVGREVTYNKIIGIKDIKLFSPDSLKSWFMEHPELKNTMNTKSYSFFRDHGFME